MPDEPSQQPDDFWNTLDEAELTVKTWPAWQQTYEADIFYEIPNEEEPKS
jgi:hypothetical protein